MKREEFLDFDTIKIYITHHEPNQPYKFKDVLKFVCCMSYKEGYFCAVGYGENSPLGGVTLMLERAAFEYASSKFNLSAVPLLPKHT